MPLKLTCVSYALTTIGLAHHMSVNYSCHPNFVDARTYMVSSIFQMATIVATPALPMPNARTCTLSNIFYVATIVATPTLPIHILVRCRKFF